MMCFLKKLPLWSCSSDTIKDIFLVLLGQELLQTPLRVRSELLTQAGDAGLHEYLNSETASSSY